MNVVFALLIWLFCALLWVAKFLFFGGWVATRAIAYLTWPIWATIVGLGALVGLM